jgi:hypothetical protein
LLGVRLFLDATGKRAERFDNEWIKWNVIEGRFCVGVIERQQALVVEINEREAPYGRTALELQALWIADRDAPRFIARQQIGGGRRADASA